MMSDQTDALGGVSLSGDLSEPALPSEDNVTTSGDWTPNDIAVEEPVADAPVEPLEVPTPVEEAAAPVEEPQAAAPEAAPKATKAKKPATEGAFRPYVVLEEIELEGGTKAYVEVHRLESRNAQVALRDAFKAICAQDSTKTTATLVVVPQRMWTPTKVAIQTRHTVSVTA